MLIEGVEQILRPVPLFEWAGPKADRVVFYGFANAENAPTPPPTAGAPNALPPNALVVVVTVEDWPSLLWPSTNP